MEQILLFYDFSKYDYLQIRPKNGLSPIKPGLKELVLAPLSNTGLDDQHFYVLRIVNLNKLPKYSEDKKPAPDASESFLFNPENGLATIETNFVPGVYFLYIHAYPLTTPEDLRGICYCTKGASMVVGEC